MTRITASELKDWVGRDTGTSDWLLMEQQMVNNFADVTYDHQFIHIDPEAAAKTPFGGTIAHGFFTLSLLTKLSESATLRVEGTKMGVNYGLEKVRFLAPVRVGKRIRAHGKLAAVEEKRPGQFLLTNEFTVEIEGEDKPALIAQWLTMIYV